MAASDPSPYVATPTGTLQGVAAFSWDGSAWQPSGRAGPDVATPTGVLQGVAPFSWDGTNWQPAGRAQPGVATSSGVLDGVAVYTWSGSAWTPASGTATPATPSGALRGIAAFSWDGAAWQPAAQARASVPTPYGVLDGVAFFNWGGSTWQAGAAVPAGATLDLSFFGPTLDPRITFTRASTATYFDSGGTMQTAATNTPRFDYDPATHALRGLLIEEARTNLVPNSIDFTTNWGPSGVTVTANADTSPMGTITMSRLTETAANVVHYNPTGPITVVPSTAYTASVFAKMAQNRYLQLVYDDNTNGGFVTFDLQTGTISQAAQVRNAGTNASATIQSVGNGIYRCTLTATAITNTNGRVALVLVNAPTPGYAPAYLGNAANGLSVWGCQLEAGVFPTSYIPTTAAAVTRAYDSCFIASANMGWFTAPGGSWSAEFVNNITTASTSPRIIGINSAAGITPMYESTARVLTTYDGGQTQSVNTIASGAISKGASSWAPASGRACLNGGAIGLTATMVTGFAALAAAGIGIMGGNPGVVNETMTGYIRRVRYWPRILTDAEMQQVTT